MLRVWVTSDPFAKKHEGISSYKACLNQEALGRLGKLNEIGELIVYILL